MKFWLCASGLIILLTSASAQAPIRKPARRPNPVRRNESTLAGLRPGRDLVSHAKTLYGPPKRERAIDPEQTWYAMCRSEVLFLDPDERGLIRTVKVAEENWLLAKCRPQPPSPWRTGRRLRVRDACSRAIALYGVPSSRGPSTKDGQELELFFYQFDWAGSNVPQVMEVLCTPEKNGKPGRVVEIMLAAPSL